MLTTGDPGLAERVRKVCAAEPRKDTGWLARRLLRTGFEATVTSPLVFTAAVYPALRMVPRKRGAEDRFASGSELRRSLMAGQPTQPSGTLAWRPLAAFAVLLVAGVDLAALPADTPAGVRGLVARSLERNPKGRLRDIGDARHHLDDRPEVVGPEAAPSGRAGISRRALLRGAAFDLLSAGAGVGGAWMARRKTPAEAPSYRRLTFRRGIIRTAKFGPDFQTEPYGALRDGDIGRVYPVRPESPESAPPALPPAGPVAVSATGELALSRGTHMRDIVPYGAPRELQERVKYAD
jgi:hypothetical protein